MYKYQEALNNVKRVYVESEHYDEEDIRLLQELVDKATPKKPIKSNNPLFDYMVFCPACYKSMSFKNYYCGSCGQEVDWSDEDE